MRVSSSRIDGRAQIGWMTSFTLIATFVLVPGYRPSLDTDTDTNKTSSQEADQTDVVKQYEARIQELEQQLEATRSHRKEHIEVGRRGEARAEEGQRLGDAESFQSESSMSAEITGYEDLTTESLLDILEPHADSPFWESAAVSIAHACVSDIKLARSKHDTSSSVEGQGGSSELEQDASSLSNLSTNHPMVRHAIFSALQIPAREGGSSQRNPNWTTALTCARDLDSTTVPIDQDLEKNKDNAVKNSEADAAMGGGDSGKLKAVVVSAWSDVKTAVGEFASLLAGFIKWEFGVALFPVPLVPTIGWKCQPISECVIRLGKMIGVFVKLLYRIVAGLVKLIHAIVTAIANAIGRFFGYLYNAAGKAISKFTNMFSFSGNSLLDQSFHKTLLVSSDDVDTDRIMHSPLFISADTSGECTRCSLRIKGTIALAGWGVFLTSVPMYLNGLGRGCKSCYHQYKRRVTTMFGVASEEQTGVDEKYFTACNPNSVGLCMLLDRLRYNKMRLKRGCLLEDTSKDLGAHFCKALTGMELRLSKFDDVVRCPKVYIDDFVSRNGRHPELSAKYITKLSMSRGCSIVRDRLERFDTECSANILQDEPESRRMDMCKAIFECPKRVTSGSSIDWGAMHRTIRDIVGTVDDYQGTPTSQTPEQATQAILELTKQWEAGRQNFEVTVDEFRDWNFGDKITTENLFRTEEWDDRCFTSLVPEHGAKKKNEIGELYAKIGPKIGHQHPVDSSVFYRFFWRLDRYLALGARQKKNSGAARPLCPQLDERSDWPKRLFERRDVEGQVHYLFVDADHLRMSAASMQNSSLVLEPFGLIANAHVRLSVSDGDWILAYCSLGLCEEAQPGQRLFQLSVQRLTGTEAEQFRIHAEALVKHVRRMETSLLNGSRYADQRHFADFMKQVVQNAELRPTESIDATVSRTIANSQQFSDIKNMAESGRLGFLQRRHWSLNNKLQLRWYGRPLDNIAQLRRLAGQSELPHWEALMLLRDAVKQIGLGLAEAVSTEVLYDSKVDRAQGNPLAKVPMNEAEFLIVHLQFHHAVQVF